MSKPLLERKVKVANVPVHMEVYLAEEIDDILKERIVEVCEKAERLGELVEKLEKLGIRVFDLGEVCKAVDPYYMECTRQYMLFDRSGLGTIGELRFVFRRDTSTGDLMPP